MASCRSTKDCGRVHELVIAYLDGENPAGDLVAEPAAIRCGTAIIYLRLVDAELPILRVFSPLLRGVERSPQLLVQLNELNARLNFLRLSDIRRPRSQPGRRGHPRPTANRTDTGTASP